MITSQKIFPQNFSGSLRVKHAESLAKLSTIERQNFVRPDCFDEKSNWYRLSDVDKSLTAIKISNSGFVSWGSQSQLSHEAILNHIHRLVIPIDLPDEAVTHLPRLLANRLKQLAPLVHVASASLEEAIIKAIIRQVIKASHAKKLIHRFITQFGENYEYEGFTCYRFPTPEKVLETSLDNFISCGLGFKAKLLKDVIQRLANDDIQAILFRASHQTIMENLQEIRGIGPWTAHITVCDITGNWSLYPFDDLAVRTWAAKLWPTQNWPSDPEDFKKAWENLNGPYVGQITFYLLSLAVLLSERKGHDDCWTQAQLFSGRSFH